MTMETVKFTVDSALLKELGERLVGRQYIALAELVKNSFDADALKVEIRIEEDCIEVSDNGHGISKADFIDRWMRVGSTHKVGEESSPEFHRPLTGSKGIGRLAVQFLASEMELISVPKETRVPADKAPSEIYAVIDWDTAVEAGDLTQATADYELTKPKSVFPTGKPHGTTVRLKKLKHEWEPAEFEDLAREIWFLQPPFRSLTGANGEATEFKVDLISADTQAVSMFETQISRILDLYSARLVGILLPTDDPKKSARRKIRLSLELEEPPLQIYEYEIPVQDAGPCLINSLEFEIRIFTLQNRQPYGISVGEARKYMDEWGGVHIYDAGFRIPYAGPAADWLRLEFDHSHRLTASQLLPSELNVKQGLNFLPTNSRVLGVVKIDTADEGRAATLKGTPSNQHLQIQVSRDRLVSNGAFLHLRNAVRFALDYYANRLAVVRLKEKIATRDVGAPTSLVEGVWDVLERNEDKIPKPVATELKTALQTTLVSVRDQAEWTRNQSGLLGAMATVGMSAIAFDHEFNQQLSVLEEYTGTLEDLMKTRPELQDPIKPIAQRIRSWIRNARASRAIFSPITDKGNRTTVGRFVAKNLISGIAENMKTILRGVRVDVSGTSRDLRLPQSSYPVWMAIFHNVLMNASNAMTDSDVRRISISSNESGNRKRIHVQDTGVGIDLSKAEDLFKPLERGLDISPERRMLGYGGTGLGLAIVRMLATDISADVHFVKPEEPFKTCFEISWSEAYDSD